MASEKPYQKNLADEIDFKVVDQLHTAVSQISGFCFEIKKFCIATLFIVLTFIAKFTQDSLDSSIFISSYCMIFSFWFLDSVAYYYQVKLRGKMLSTIDSIKIRNSESDINNESKDFIIDKKRIDIKTIKKVFFAGINHSMWLYLILLIFTVIAHMLYSNGLIK